MSFRSRLLIGFTIAAALPLGVLAFGVRGEVVERLTTEFEQRRETRVRAVANDIAQESADIARRLRALVEGLSEDDRFRQATLRGDPGARPYLLDFGTRAMAVTGLPMIQLQDSTGRILSSGHFRQEFDRIDADLAVLVRANAESATLVQARAPTGEFLALVRVDTAVVGGRQFVLIGGMRVDSARLAAFTGDDLVRAELAVENDVVLAAGDTAGPLVRDTIGLVFADVQPGGGRLAPARIVLVHSLASLDATRADVDRWLWIALSLVAIGAIALATWLSARFSRAVETQLRASAGRLREAERRATIGEFARQVNHDIKNGLIPIRNVLRHLSGVAEQEPGALPQAFGERRATLESSVDYLDRLSRTWAKLTPRADRSAIDANAVVAEAAQSAAMSDRVKVRTDLASGLPRIHADALALRRIVDNLLANAIDSFEDATGTVHVRTAATNGGVSIVVADTGKGMTREELGRAFEAFFTTKADGTGLGLSVVRRLASDLGGDVRAESTPGRGTTMTVTLPVQGR